MRWDDRAVREEIAWVRTQPRASLRWWAVHLARKLNPCERATRMRWQLLMQPPRGGARPHHPSRDEDSMSGTPDNDDYQPGRWWRVTAPDGSLWCETSDEDEARQALRPGDTLERLFVLTRSEWRPVSEAADPPPADDGPPPGPAAPYMGGG